MALLNLLPLVSSGATFFSLQKDMCTADKVLLAAAPQIEIVEAATLDAGLNALASRRDKFDTVILSPGAPSYGQLERPGVPFKNFEERGNAFIRIARDVFAT